MDLVEVDVVDDVVSRHRVDLDDIRLIEIWVDTVTLARPGRARGGGDRVEETVVAGHQAFHQRVLPRARRARHDEQQTRAGQNASSSRSARQ